MIRNFNLQEILQNIVGYKGLPFPGGWLPSAKAGGYAGKDYTGLTQAGEKKELSDTGARLRKKDMNGRWYFMPVVFMHDGSEYEIPNAIISIKGKKTIVETPMIGRKGTVKELVSIDDYEISIAGVIIDDDDFPEDGLSNINELFNINQSVRLKCALTDIFMDDDDMVVITDLDCPEVKGIERARGIRINCKSDKNFELNIE